MLRKTILSFSVLGVLAMATDGMAMKEELHLKKGAREERVELGERAPKSDDNESLNPRLRFGPLDGIKKEVRLIEQE